MSAGLPGEKGERKKKRYLVRLVDVLGVGIGKAVVLVEDDGANAGLQTAGVQHAVERDGEVVKGGDGVVRETCARLEEEARRVERGGEIEIHCVQCGCRCCRWR